MTGVVVPDLDPVVPEPVAWDVTVRVPVAFERASEAAGFVHAVVASAMVTNGWAGEPLALWRSDDTNLIVGFHAGIIDPYSGLLPHGLLEPAVDNSAVMADVQAVIDEHGIDAVLNAATQAQVEQAARDAVAP